MHRHGRGRSAVSHSRVASEPVPERPVTKRRRRPAEAPTAALRGVVHDITRPSRPAAPFSARTSRRSRTHRQRRSNRCWKFATRHQRQHAPGTSFIRRCRGGPRGATAATRSSIAGQPTLRRVISATCCADDAEPRGCRARLRRGGRPARAPPKQDDGNYAYAAACSRRPAPDWPDDAGRKLAALGIPAAIVADAVCGGQHRGRRHIAPS